VRCVLAITKNILVLTIKLVICSSIFHYKKIVFLELLNFKIYICPRPYFLFCFQHVQKRAKSRAPALPPVVREAPDQFASRAKPSLGRVPSARLQPSPSARPGSPG
jgi:hypothetical protein